MGEMKSAAIFILEGPRDGAENTAATLLGENAIAREYP